MNLSWDRPRILAAIFVAMLPAMASAQAGTGTTTIAAINIGPDGAVHIVHSDGREFVPPKETDQVGTSSPIVTEDKRSAGWLVDFENCCTSYPIPLKLVVYRLGKPLRRFEPGMGIFDWCFVAGGKQVAFYTDTVHSNLAPHFELRDVESGRLVSKWDGHLNKRSRPGHGC